MVIKTDKRYVVDFVYLKSYIRFDFVGRTKRKIMKKELINYNRSVLVIIMIVMNLILAPCMLVSFITEIYIAVFAFYLTSVIFNIIFLVFIIYFTGLQNKNKEIMNKGYKTVGTVISVNEKNRRKVESGHSYSYSLNIKYNDYNGVERIYKTPRLKFKPKITDNTTCDVYVYNNQIYVTNFVNLYQDKFQEMAPIIGLIAGVLIVVVMMFAAMIKNTFF